MTLTKFERRKNILYLDHLTLSWEVSVILATYKLLPGAFPPVPHPYCSTTFSQSYCGTINTSTEEEQERACKAHEEYFTSSSTDASSWLILGSSDNLIMIGVAQSQAHYAARCLGSLSLRCGPTSFTYDCSAGQSLIKCLDKALHSWLNVLQSWEICNKNHWRYVPFLVDACWDTSASP